MSDHPSSSSSTEAQGVAALARSQASAPFWNGLAAGLLCIPHCSTCHRRFFPPRRRCPHCWSEHITWERVSGHGRIYAVSTVHVPFHPSMAVPATVALIDLDEGVRLIGRVEPVSDHIPVGTTVEIVFASDPAAELPVFRPVPPLPTPATKER